MKLIEYKPELETESFNGTSLNNFWMPFPDPEGLNPFINYEEIWEAAKPKLNKGLIDQLDKAPIIFGTPGEKAIRENFINDDFYDMHILSESPMQEIDWIDRKRKCPLLTVKDLQWIDKMVDEIFEKHAGYLKKNNFYFYFSERFSPAISTDKFLFPL